MFGNTQLRNGGTFMSGMKRYLWLFVVAMVLIMVSSTVEASSESVAFSSKRSGTGKVS